MDELIETIYQLTVDMGPLLQKEDVEGFLGLLSERSVLMNKVDSSKEEQPEYQYSLREKKLLEEILRLDQSYTPVLMERMAVTQTLLKQAKKIKAVSKKYHPYITQTSGAFIDSNK